MIDLLFQPGQAEIFQTASEKRRQLRAALVIERVKMEDR